MDKKKPAQLASPFGRHARLESVRQRGSLEMAERIAPLHAAISIILGGQDVSNEASRTVLKARGLPKATKLGVLGGRFALESRFH